MAGGPRCAWGSRSASLLRRETVPLARSPTKSSKRSVDTPFAFHHRFLGVRHCPGRRVEQVRELPLV
jgi:hypothetical protein